MALLFLQVNPQMVLEPKAPLKVGIVLVFLMIGIVDIEFSDIFSTKSFPCL